MRLPSSLLVPAATLLLTTLAHPAHAFTASTTITDGCHESITYEALRQIRARLSSAAAITPTSDERALIDDLPFPVPDDSREMAATSLVLGNRDNDFRGLEPTELTQLGQVHADPGTQDAHCLRAPGDDEPGGSQAALLRCRAYVKARVTEALAALDAAGAVDPGQRMPLRVTLDLRGQVSPPLPVFWVRMGQALHALQDSFSHAFRTADGKRITVILNYVDYADDDGDESRDGPKHLKTLDGCKDEDALLGLRHRLAIDASIALLQAALDPSTPAADRAARVDAVLDDYLGFQPGCSPDNAWCNAPERRYGERGCGCGVPGTTRVWPAALSALVVMGIVARRRRRLAAAASVGLLAWPSPARADEPPCPERCTPVEETTPLGSPFGVAAMMGVAIDQAGANASLGGRYRLDAKWLVGLDVESNPWMSLQTKKIEPGTVNVYATLVRRWRLRPHNLKLRTTAHAGTATLLFDLYGAPKGSTGPYVGVNFLGLEIDLDPKWSIIIDPADVAFVVPQTSGTPLVRREYRFTIGLQWGGLAVHGGSDHSNARDRRGRIMAVFFD